MKYDLTDFFKKVCEEIPELKHEISKYKQIIRNSNREIALHISKESLFDERIEYYEQTVDLYGGSYYTITWNIGLAKNIAKKHYPQNPNMEFYLPTIAKFVDADTLDKAYFHQALQNNEPIIAAYHPGVDPPFVIIDGNHRVMSKVNAGEKYISGYLLKPTMHLECMASTLDQALYIMHHNLVNCIRELNQEPLMDPKFNESFIDIKSYLLG